VFSAVVGLFVTNKPTTAENTPPPHSYGNQRLQRQFDGLLMMGIVIPETCWAVSVRQSNKFYDLLLHLVGCFIWVLVICLRRKNRKRNRWMMVMEKVNLQQHFCVQWEQLALQDTSWGCMLRIRWWLPTAVLRTTVNCFCRSKEIATYFIRQWPWTNFLVAIEICLMFNAAQYYFNVFRFIRNVNCYFLHFKFSPMLHSF